MGRLTRYLKPAQVLLDLDVDVEPPEGITPERHVWRIKEQVLDRIAALLDASGNIVNPSKLRTDLVNREKKAATALGEGIAIPHVRTLQAREFTLAFARSVPGIPFGAPDDAPVHFFLAVVAPPYDDKLYLEVYKSIGEIFREEWVRDSILGADSVHDVIKVISSFEG